VEVDKCDVADTGIVSPLLDLKRQRVIPSVHRDFDWSTINATPLECPCRARNDREGPCVLDVGTRSDFLAWLERAATKLDLESMFEFRYGFDVGKGWKAIKDPEGGADATVLGRVAISADAGAIRGTFDSPATGRRRTLVEQVARNHALDDLETGALQLAFDTEVELPVDVELRWSHGYWKTEGPPALGRIVESIKRNGSLGGVVSVLQDRHAVRCLVWLSETRPAGYEAFVLELERSCEPQHLRALRRAIDREAANRRGNIRVRLAREQLAVPTWASTDDLVRRLLDAIADYLRAHNAQIWRGRSERRRIEHGVDWIGRWDAGNSAIAVEAEIVRTILGRFGEPQTLLHVLSERGLLKPGPSGFRWQQRIARSRKNCYAFAPAALPGIEP
jgi:hypothetical protein